MLRSRERVSRGRAAPVVRKHEDAPMNDGSALVPIALVMIGLATWTVAVDSELDYRVIAITACLSGLFAFALMRAARHR